MNPYYYYLRYPFAWIGLLLGFSIALGLVLLVLSLLNKKLSYLEYVKQFLKDHWLALAITVVALPMTRWQGALVLLGVIVGGKWLFVKLFLAEKRRLAKWKQDIEDDDAAWLASLGATPDERVASINQIFDRKEKTLSISRWTVVEGVVAGDVKTGNACYTISRNLAAMDTRQREMLRMLELMYVAGLFERKIDYKLAKTGLIWGDGKGSIDAWYHDGGGGLGAARDGQALLQRCMAADECSVESAITSVLRKLETATADASLNADGKKLVTTINRRMSGGNTWLQQDEIDETTFAPRGEYNLQLGMLDGTDYPLTYSGEGSMITIAPPGSGKTQCNVFPNLLRWKGPAVVLDVKGEIYAGTSKWRAENVGPVYKFSPLDPANSHCYNPLSFIRSETDYIWEDSRFLADMMIVPSGAADPFWENKARDLLTAAIAYVCYMNPPDERPMSAIVDIIHGGDPLEEMIVGLKSATDVRSMVQQGTSLGGMNEKTRDSVLQTAQSSLSAWSGERIGRATRRSDWSPLDLRSDAHPTIYICLKPSEVESYISVLRVFIAQHIRMLTNELPPRGAAPILFLLDELPRLRQMPPVEEAIEVGRQYGLRLWMFAQSLGQLEKAYPNAEGMVGSCAVRIFMNPSSHDGTAEKLSDELGYRESALDSSRQKIVEATELAGPDYRDYQIVMAASSKPARVRKAFAYQNDELMARMGSL